MAPTKYMFVGEVCRELGISRRTLMRMRAEQRCPLVELPRFGQRLRFSRESVDLYLQSRWSPARRMAS
jgi:excisionase family DNA binding protein